MLDLPDCWVIKLVVESGAGYIVDAEQKTVMSECCYCGGMLVRFGFGCCIISDVPSNGRWVKVRLQRQRFRCRACTRTSKDAICSTTERIRATIRLVEYVRREAAQRGKSRVAGEVGLSESEVRRILRLGLAS